MDEYMRDARFMAGFLSGQDNVAIDIGGYRGDFSSALLDTGVISKLHVFEPNPELFAFLQTRFSGAPVVLHSVAVSDKAGCFSFSCDRDLATGSLLPYAEEYKTVGEVGSIPVDVVTLDSWVKSNSIDRLDLIKIDTQGNDLLVLKGGGEVIERFRPVICVEVIFSELYAGQTSLSDILAFFSEKGYFLSRMRNIHEDEHGHLAFADLFFCPDEVRTRCAGKYVQIDNGLSLEKQIKTLEEICAERLKVINELDAALKSKANAEKPKRWWLRGK